jgi:hypothetical protein
MYFRIQYTLHGKEFDCHVKSDDENRFWTCVYINPLNPKNDCFVRREAGSPMLFNHKVDTDERTFLSALEQVYTTARYV